MILYGMRTENTSTIAIIGCGVLSYGKLFFYVYTLKFPGIKHKSNILHDPEESIFTIFLGLRLKNSIKTSPLVNPSAVPSPGTQLQACFEGALKQF